MDLALAYTLQAKLEAEGKSLDAWQFLALVHAASQAKITLFEDAALAEAPIAVPSRGSSLFAKTIATALDRASLSQVILDGFFAQTATRRFAARGTSERAAGIRAALRVRSSDQQASGPLPHAQPAEREGERQAGRTARRASRRASADAHRRVVQWRRVQGRADPRPSAGSAGVLEWRAGGPRARGVRA